MKSPLYTIHYTVYNIHSDALYNIHYTVYTIHVRIICTLYFYNTLCTDT